MSKYCYIYVLRSVKDNQFYVGLTREFTCASAPACETRALPYAGAPPRAPGSDGATSGATTCLGGLSGSFLVGVELMPGGGLIRRPWSMISLICEPSRVSYSSKAFAMVSSVSR